MSILVYGSFLSRSADILTDDFLFETVKRLPGINPAARVLFLVSAETGLRHPLYECGETVVEAPGAGKAGRWWWSIKTLPAFLKQEQVNLAISYPENRNNNRIPLMMVVSELLPSAKNAAALTKKLAGAAAVVTTSNWGKTQLASVFQVPENKITVIPAAADTRFQPVEWDEKEAVKEKYAGGNEFFLFPCLPGHLQAVTEVLKAFSVFKKWQKSNMQLLVTGLGAEEQAALKLDAYRFRADVSLLPVLRTEELAAITAAAYGCVQPGLPDPACMAAIRSLQCEIPVIASSTGAFPEICGAAALYAEPGDFNDMGQKMILLYKDETLRRQLIATAKTQKLLYNWDASAALFSSLLHHP
ncbi:glycosyltransferase [Filimonas effusa]|uniref:Glycosyltransferase n=1 Tax=Filimonas effusa TaxID=2508721 RepID=A0A4Q1CZN4_9BACT|nr:glycosyltransferase [Filimonas effusa]RXK80878.1 glycosyltransferase [Filimonas effusa]